MDTQRIFLAIFLSLAILFGYQYFFIPPMPPAPLETTRVEPAEQPSKDIATNPSAHQALLSPPDIAPGQTSAPARVGRDIPVTTSLFSALISENGGTIKSFRLNDYREELRSDSAHKELIHTKAADGFPLDFSWGTEPGSQATVVYEATTEQLNLPQAGETASLSMRAQLPSGLELIRTLRFDNQHYLMELTIDLVNRTANPLQGAPYLVLVNRPFSKENSFIFNGPALLRDGVLEEVKPDDLKKAPQTFTGKINWAAYEDNYFFCGLIPLTGAQHTVQLSLADGNRVRTVLAGAADTILPGGQRQYRYQVYFGPKKLASLKAAGNGLERSLDFGWFDVLAKPMLFMLNFFHSYIGNYGLAIILVTILIKLLFWPIAQKGMKSMKTMQKIQPKMAKLREKYKDDKQMQQQEMIKLYQTYKVNPVGGCLPMILQIPVFFALYKVLLQTIELRHAPFFLWINDLSAPDRLFIGFDIPYLGGIPVLTLLMGASMFLQQKMTPASGDPTQQKVMMFMPVIFTFMFLNFASGLVLYWFINNLLAIAQQYLINRQED